MPQSHERGVKRRAAFLRGRREVPISPPRSVPPTPKKSACKHRKHVSCLDQKNKKPARGRGIGATRESRSWFCGAAPIPARPGGPLVPGPAAEQQGTARAPPERDGGGDHRGLVRRKHRLSSEAGAHWSPSPDFHSCVPASRKGCNSVLT